MTTYNVGPYNFGLYNVGLPPGELEGLGPSHRRAYVATEGATAPKVLAKFTQQPDETLDYDVVYEGWFTGRLDEPLEASVTVEAGITIEAIELRQPPVWPERYVKIVLSGVTADVTHKVTTLLTTDAGIIKEAEFAVKGKVV